MGVLRVKVGGNWVDVGGSSDPIWVDPVAPSDPNVELWYDTDATSFDPPQLAALGRVAIGPVFDVVSSGTTKLVAGATPATQMNANRKYRACLDLSAGYYGTVLADLFLLNVEQDGVGLSGGIPVYIFSANQYLPPGQISVAFTATTGSHVYQATCTRAAGTGNLQFRGRVYIYDEGPL